MIKDDDLMEALISFQNVFKVAKASQAAQNHPDADAAVRWLDTVGQRIFVELESRGIQFEDEEEEGEGTPPTGGEVAPDDDPRCSEHRVLH